jgi:hypothetical protein
MSLLNELFYEPTSILKKNPQRPSTQQMMQPPKQSRLDYSHLEEEMYSEQQQERNFQPITRTISFAEEGNQPPQQQIQQQPLRQIPPQMQQQVVVEEAIAKPNFTEKEVFFENYQSAQPIVHKRYPRNGKFKFEVKGDCKEIASCAKNLLFHRKPFDWYENLTAKVVNESEQIIDHETYQTLESRLPPVTETVQVRPASMPRQAFPSGGIAVSDAVGSYESEAAAILSRGQSRLFNQPQTVSFGGQNIELGPKFSTAFATGSGLTAPQLGRFSQAAAAAGFDQVSPGFQGGQNKQAASLAPQLFGIAPQSTRGFADRGFHPSRNISGGPSAAGYDYDPSFEQQGGAFSPYASDNASRLQPRSPTEAFNGRNSSNLAPQGYKDQYGRISVRSYLGDAFVSKMMRKRHQ